MRFRRSSALAVLILASGLMLLMYLVFDTVSEGSIESNTIQIDLSNLESKLRGLENELLLNQKTLEKIHETVQDLKTEQGVISEESKALRTKGKTHVNLTIAEVHKNDEIFAQTASSKCDIRMIDVYEKIPFDNPDGGAWKQGWEISYDPKQWNSTNKLKVIVMPHSHNDPGWVKTFEEYYQSDTKHILTNMVEKLSEYPQFKFIWAEISFFSMWWAEQSLEIQNKLKSLIENGQFEMVTGGWVMNDEANSYLYGIVEQLILGHEWLKLNLDYRPNAGWSIDPFGMSPTMAYILKRVGLDATLIQRTHYSVKKFLAKEKSLEFMWRQHWDHDETTQLLTHMMPFYSYDIPHTCGPDPKLCCQFDFHRLPGTGITCPWGIPAIAITDQNVEERTNVILDQYRKKAQLYKTNVVLAPLGDDFRFVKSSEWDEQFKNYKKIIDYVDSHPDLNAEISFGTLSDYFSELKKEVKSTGMLESAFFPSLSGDFFTYADRDDHYWSGYYTSRPFYKNMDRILEGYLRASEIIYSIALAEMSSIGGIYQEMAETLLEYLATARQNLALFQHHDGVTGTAKSHVVADYGNRMFVSIEKLQVVLSQSAHYLLSSSKPFYKPSLNTLWFDLDDNRENHFSVPTKTVINIGLPDEPSRVVVYNSLPKKRSEMITLKINQPNVKVFKVSVVDGDEEEETIDSQVSPVFDEQGQILNTEFYLSFLAQTDTLSLHTFFIQNLRPEEGMNSHNDFANIRIHNSAKHPFQVAPFEEPDVYEVGEPFMIQNGYVRAEFSADGMLQTVMTLEDRKKSQVKLEFIAYGTRQNGDKSGAYLFLPDGPAELLPVEKPYVRVIEGKLLSYVEVFLPHVKHVVTLKSSPGPDGTGIQIDNEIDIRGFDNREIAMRINSDVESGETFFTDLNGFQMIRRKRYQKLPLQGNYYPIPSMAYIKDDTTRLTLISRQPLGGSSLQSGHLEIMMDRRLMQDDNRGLFQDVTDNLVTSHSFFLLLERKLDGCTDEPEGEEGSYPSLTAISIRHAMINPLYRLVFVADRPLGSGMLKHYAPTSKESACDIHLVNLRTMVKNQYKLEPSEGTALILHREGFNSCYKPIGLTCSTNEGKISIEEIFPKIFDVTVNQMSLSLIYDGVKVEKGFTVSIKPMEMYSFLMKR